MTDETTTAEPSIVAKSRKGKPRKQQPYGERYAVTAEEQAAADAEFAEVQEKEEARGKGKKLTNLKRIELINAIRSGMANAMKPASIKAAISSKFKVSGQTVEKYLGIVRQEQIKQVGYWQHQIEELCQTALVKMVQDNGAANSEKINAIKMLDNMFDIRVKPENKLEAQRKIAEDAMARMDKMTMQELSQFTEVLRQGGGKLTAEMLQPWGDDERSKKIEDVTPKRKYRKSRAKRELAE